MLIELAGEGRPVLSWDKRVKIAAGAARGIAYLHEDCNYHSFIPIILDDMKNWKVIGIHACALPFLINM